MASVEGLWQFQSGMVGSEMSPVFGGIVVLESGRVLGGDSAMAYVGDYAVETGVLMARVHSWTWNTDLALDQVTNVFGMTGVIDHFVMFKGTVGETTIEGHLWPEDHPEARLLARLKKIAELP